MRITITCISLLAITLPCLTRAAERINFNRDVRPVLSENCFACHGPDAHELKAKLRLDVRDSAVAPAESGAKALIPGDPDQSELIKRLITGDEDDHMPPAKTGKKLKPAQIEVLRQWIKEGADYSTHWAFAPPQPATPPAVQDGLKARNPIDNFVLATQVAKGLKPAPEANKNTLIRRLSLDLLGLPPSPADIQTFLADESPDAYEKLVDRLLASPHYGERMALEWLDAARFADTHGYHIDSGRDMTRWREWVIDAFNNNMPFDQFTVEQLAGDLLPNATIEQKIASGFNRNHMINFEGGAIADEYLAAYVMDRVNTTSTVWLGLTMACAQCHDHKYDPLTMKDYYSFYAFFNNVADNGLDGGKGNAVPLIETPGKYQSETLQQLQGEIKAAEDALTAELPDVDAAQTAWEATASKQSDDWKTASVTAAKSTGGTTLTKQPDDSWLASGTKPAQDDYEFTIQLPPGDCHGLRLEALPDASFDGGGTGRAPNGNFVLTNVSVEANGKPVPLATAKADYEQANYPIGNAIDQDPASGWAIDGDKHREARTAWFAFAQPLNSSQSASIKVRLHFQSQFSAHAIGRPRISLTSSPTAAAGAAGLPPALAASLKKSAAERTAEEKTELKKYYRQNISPSIAALQTRAAAARAEVAKLQSVVSSTMIMSERSPARDTFILERGQYDKKAAKVTPETPAALPPMDPSLPKNRLGLARWLVAPTNPLTARVTVNRYWQIYFGTGIVATAENFGSQADWPSQPELLDWLALEFIRSGWNVKALQKLIVTSATYRQNSRWDKSLNPGLEDPDNRLLTRGPRFRLHAEIIRDLALSASGLLNDRIGGASVNPYQPAGLWEELMSRADGANWTAQKFEQSHGADLYRRGLYTFWKRTSPPASLSTMDAPDREVCVVRRPRTNTPLQALLLMNDPTYVEAARKLAERLLAEKPDDPSRLQHLFLLVLGRAATPEEGRILGKLWQSQLAVFQADPSAAGKLLAVGETPPGNNVDIPQLAAWSVVCSAVLNLDEAITKG